MGFNQNLGLLWSALFLWSCGYSPPATAATRRAVLVGINQYLPASGQISSGRSFYLNLHGCVNDAQAMREMLIAKFQFEPANVQTLLDSQATRADILGTIKKRLIDDAAPGDICLFFYAGHGSLIRNLKSTKPSGMDSTLVPADSYAGVADIRDKELSRLFGRALDKGVVLTAIFDSCHSGSIARGLPSHVVSRELSPEPNVVSDPPDPGKPPEERGALILSAAQDYQAAGEAEDDNGHVHGAFTGALLKAFAGAPPGEPAEQLFLSAEVRLEAEKPDQIPVLAGIAERRQKPLLGVGAGIASARMIVAAQSVDLDNAVVNLRGGQAIGLKVGCELQRLARGGEAADQAAVRLRVTTVADFATATATVISGDLTNIQGGDLFAVTQWVYPDAATLRVWIPPASLTIADLNSLAPELAALRSSSQVEWVADPAEVTPTHVLSRTGSGWTLSGIGGLGKRLSAQVVLQKLAAHARQSGKPRLFVDLPPPRELIRDLQFGKGTPNSSLKPVSSADAANYCLAGHWRPEGIEYSWLRPDAAKNDQQVNPLPARTDWFALGDGGKSTADTANTLVEKALRIGRLKAWLTLDSYGSADYFPYHLALRNTTNGGNKAFGETVFDGEPYGLVLLANPGSDLQRDSVAKQWVYVVVIDSWGHTQLVFPQVTQGNVGNHVPYDPLDKASPAYPSEIPLGAAAGATLFTVAKPFGVDTYVLLVSKEAIPQPSVFNGDGVRSRGPGGANPLQDLLENVGARSRAAAPVIPSNWSVQKLSIKSAAQP